jgi:glycerol transport system substrate-binding protein
MDSPDSPYDGWVTDSDLIGTHYRYGLVEPLTDYMKEDGRDFTSPTLDLKDFIGLKFTTGPDGKLYQLPDQQFANLYWFRADWFAREDLQQRFREKYGYALGVPLNWSAYEDIAEFFSVHVRNSMANAFMVIWIMVPVIPHWDGVLRMHGCRWQVLRIRFAKRIACRRVGYSCCR